MPEIILVDTTLRDGEQAPGFAFTPQVKIRLARLLDAAGVGQIEAGVPAMGAAEKEVVRGVRAACAQARVSTWNRLHEGDIRQSLDCAPHIIHLCCPISDRQIREKLKSTRPQVLDLLRRCVALAASRGAEVTVGFEDASHATPDQLRQAAQAARQAGVRRVRCSDTVGAYTPDQVWRAVRVLREAGLDVEIHAHNDLGMAVANSLMAASAGAAYVNTTLWGIGERAGNCGLAAFAHAAARLGGAACAVAPEAARDLEQEAAALLPAHALDAWGLGPRRPFGH
ncbi:homocitrate synthase [Desulfovibrio legallii]|uniref:Homocitrate synthase NifV n=1 Tax=Desulfovibrio legallii TaxID=571438 RepID=A0A1G7PK19_9BACT|nr:homocitrate synthase [Desulfovibrio legallii]SDF86009.1 homocitrate synthase NifV [Desulfovibrio legallii]